MSRRIPHGRADTSARDRGGAEDTARRTPGVPAGPSNLGDAFNLTIEFLAALLTWGGVGWLVDRWLGTDPWLLILGLVVGNACGIYLLWLRSRSPEEIERAIEAHRKNRG